MNDRDLTKPRAETLAGFVHSLRSDWDQPGIVANLAKARDRGDAYVIAIAAIRAAAQPTNRTPAVIPLDGQHWRQPAAEDEPKATYTPAQVGDQRCRCGLWRVRGEPHVCARRADPETAAEMAAAARAELAKAKTTNEETDVVQPTVVKGEG